LAARGKQQDENATAKKIVIKKYANRRLYNTDRSSYVTLDDLSQMVRAGEDFAVYDAKTGEDITRSVLTQIIFEQEAKGQNMLPTNFLRQLIRLYGDTLQGVVPGYLDASMETFAKNQEQMREVFTGGGAMANFETLARTNMEWFEQAARMFSPFGVAQPQGGKVSANETPEPSEQSKPQDAGAGSTELGSDLEHLQEQLKEMQKQLEKLTRDK